MYIPEDNFQQVQGSFVFIENTSIPTRWVNSNGQGTGTKLCKVLKIYTPFFLVMKNPNQRKMIVDPYEIRFITILHSW